MITRTSSAMSWSVLMGVRASIPVKDGSVGRHLLSKKLLRSPYTNYELM
ncbi:hypothetical protein [Paenibacillus sp. BAC0078]